MAGTGAANGDQASTEHMRRHWEPDFLGIAVLARHSGERVEAARAVTREQWAAEVCSDVSFDRVISLVGELAPFFEQLDSQNRELMEMLPISPPPRKRRGESAETAAQRWFRLDAEPR